MDEVKHLNISVFQ